MFTALIRKELRQGWLYVVLGTAVILLAYFLMIVLPVDGLFEMRLTNLWFLPPTVMVVICSAAFSQESQRGTNQFLGQLPVTALKIWLAKTTSALLMILAVVFLVLAVVLPVEVIIAAAGINGGSTVPLPHRSLALSGELFLLLFSLGLLSSSLCRTETEAFLLTLVLTVSALAGFTFLTLSHFMASKFCRVLVIAIFPTILIITAFFLSYWFFSRRLYSWKRA